MELIPLLNRDELTKKRVADHGGVHAALARGKNARSRKGETERIDARFSEPACGSGAIFVPIFKRKLAAVEPKFGKSDYSGTMPCWR